MYIACFVVYILCCIPCIPLKLFCGNSSFAFVTSIITVKILVMYLRWKSFMEWGRTGSSFPLLVPFSSLASHLKYSITMCEGSGQTQEAGLIGSTQISTGMCDQSLLPRAFPSLHLPLLISVCLIDANQGSPQFPLTSWPLLPVRCVNSAFNHTHTHTHVLIHLALSILLCRARFIKISPHPFTHPDISYSQTTREHVAYMQPCTLLLFIEAVFVSTHVNAVWNVCHASLLH